MRAVLQRVKSASVLINGDIRRDIGGGLLVLLGIGVGDDERTVRAVAEKTANLRVFSDENGKLNLSAADLGLSALVISNFTLYADCSHGRRPSFTEAARPDTAIALYEQFIAELKRCGIANVETGEFGADMQVSLVNDGPITVIIDSDDLKIK